MQGEEFREGIGGGADQLWASARAGRAGTAVATHPVDAPAPAFPSGNFYATHVLIFFIPKMSRREALSANVIFRNDAGDPRCWGEQRRTRRKNQGYLAHEKTPPPPGPHQGPMNKHKRGVVS